MKKLAVMTGWLAALAFSFAPDRAVSKDGVTSPRPPVLVGERILPGHLPGIQMIERTYLFPDGSEVVIDREYWQDLEVREPLQMVLEAVLAEELAREWREEQRDCLQEAQDVAREYPRQFRHIWLRFGRGPLKERRDDP
jgi:hypothetical protein